jgi:hypothetical protein
VKDEDIGGEPLEFPEPEWYLEQFRSHVSTIHDLFKACPPQQWKTLSLAIGDALAEVREKIGLRVDFHVQAGHKEP